MLECLFIISRKFCALPFLRMLIPEGKKGQAPLEIQGHWEAVPALASVQGVGCSPDLV